MKGFILEMKRLKTREIQQVIIRRHRKKNNNNIFMKRLHSFTFYYVMQKQIIILSKLTFLFMIIKLAPKNDDAATHCFPPFFSIHPSNCVIMKGMIGLLVVIKFNKLLLLSVEMNDSRL